jgi:hypothetical protein
MHGIRPLVIGGRIVDPGFRISEDRITCRGIALRGPDASGAADRAKFLVLV